MIRSLLKRKRKPRTHDLSNTHCWMRPANQGLALSLGSWSFFQDGDPVPGDYVILRDAESDRTSRYRVTRFERMMDPKDQWFMDAVFAPRREP